MERLDCLVAQIGKWQRAINLVSRTTLPEIWHRHVADSAQLLDLAPPTTTTWADFGAGGGFPGLVIAAMAHDTYPNLRVTLVESDRRKAVFLRDTARAMGVRIDLHQGRVETLPPDQQFDVISARALAPVAKLLAMARPHLADGGTLLFPKGKDVEMELASLPAIDRDAVARIASRTHPDAAILKWA
jgi:16S rRNA (guanine527-N7)-methyltransferase